MAEKWIQKAISRPGAFKAKAKAAGKSTAAFARSALKEGSKASTRTKRQAALAQTLGKLRKGKVAFAVGLVLLGGVAHAATVPCPSGWLIGPTGQTVTNPSTNVIVPRGSPSLIVQSFLTGTSATVQVEICCSPADCTTAAGWAPVTGSVMSLTTAAPNAAVSITAPACTYRVNVTACSSCSVTALAVCGG